LLQSISIQQSKLEREQQSEIIHRSHMAVFVLFPSWLNVAYN